MNSTHRRNGDLNKYLRKIALQRAIHAVEKGPFDSKSGISTTETGTLSATRRISAQEPRILLSRMFSPLA